MELQLPESASCLQCKYPLRGLSEERCPECGRTFRAADPMTYRSRRARWWWQWARPTTRAQAVVALIALAVLLIDSSAPTLNPAMTTLRHTTGDTIEAFAAILVMCFVVLCWTRAGWLVPLLLLFTAWFGITADLLLPIAPFQPTTVLTVWGTSCLWIILFLGLDRMVALLLIQRVDIPLHVERFRSAHARRFLRVTLLCAMLGMSTIAIGPWPMWLRFRLSRDDFQAAALRANASPVGKVQTEWIGLYRVTVTRKLPGPTIFFQLDPAPQASARGAAIGFFWDEIPANGSANLPWADGHWSYDRYRW